MKRARLTAEVPQNGIHLEQFRFEERTGFGTGVNRGDVPVRYCK